MRARPRIVLTRRGEGNARVRAALAGLEVEFVEHPCIDVVPADLTPEAVADALRGAAAYVFVSRHAVEFLRQLAPDVRPAPEIIALGPGTSEALEEAGWRATALPSRAVAEVLASEAAGLVHGDGPIAYVRGDLGDDTVPRAFRALGREVRELVVYRTIAPVLPRLEPGEAPTLLVFASDSAVRHFVKQQPLTPFPHVLAIGPSTARACRDHGCEPRLAAEPNVTELARAARAWAEEQIR